MEKPKVSILIPLYNRKQYATDCIDSALNQTFQDYEIVIRDDCSTDGVFEFVQEKYAQQISEGKIRLLKNKKNIGETPTIWKLCHDAFGKYVKILHNDDILLPHALKHLYEVTEENNADVVHESFLLNSPESGIINSLQDCEPMSFERNSFDKITVMPDNPVERFAEWIGVGTHVDAQYNIFNRDFVLKNDIFENKPDPINSSLWWIMLAKVFVKTPIICYIRRQSPYSSTNMKISPEFIERFIARQFEILSDMDKRFAKMDFFKNSEAFQYMAKAHLLGARDNVFIAKKNVYANGITPELYHTVAKSFKKKFGKDYFYPMLLFNSFHALLKGHKVELINSENTTPPRYNINDIISEAA